LDLNRQALLQQSYRLGRREGSLMTLCEQLKEIVDDYLTRYPNVSINGLAMKSGVGATTLRRIKNLSIKGDPAPHTVLNIISSTSNEKCLSKILNDHDGALGELLQQSFGHFVETDAPHDYDPDLNEVLRDQVNYFIYKLSANRAGTTKMVVGELYGKLGMERLEKLIKMGLIVEKERELHAKNKNFSLDLSIAAAHLPELVKFFKHDEVQIGLNLFYSMSESLSEEGIQKVKNIQKDAVKKIYDVMQSPFYEGEIPYFSLNLAETMNATDKKGAIQ
jgi:hypothetical protein